MPRQANARRDIRASEPARLICWMSRDDPMEIETSDETVFEWDREFNNEDGMWDASEPSKITSIYEGYYLIYSEIGIAATGADFQIYLRIVLNGTTEIAKSDTRCSSAGTTFAGSANAITLYRLEVGDYLEVYVSHDGGSTLETGGATFTSQFGVKYIGASP